MLKVAACRKHLLQLRWYSHSHFGKMHCAIAISDTLRSLPIYESAASAGAPAGSAAEPRPGRTSQAGAGTITTDGGTAEGREPLAAAAIRTLPLVWLDLSGPRFLAPAGIPPAALTSSFVAADSAAAELVLSELLGVQCISQAEAYRCAMLLSPCCTSFLVAAHQSG